MSFISRAAAACLTSLAALCWVPPAAAHPSLLFTAADEPALQTKVASGVAGQAYASMCQWMWSWWFGWPYDTYSAKCLEELAFRYRMSQDPATAAEVVTALDYVVSTDPSSFYSPDTMYWFGSLPLPVALAYDLVFDQLTPAQQQAVVGHLELYGELLYDFTEAGTKDALQSDVITAYAGLGFLALAIEQESIHPDRAAWLTAAADQLSTAAFADAFNPGGSYDEGYGQCIYGVPEALRFAEAYRLATGQDLVDGAPIAAAPTWFAYGWLPHVRFPSFGEASNIYGQSFAAEHLLSIGRTGSTLGKWGWHQVHGASGIDGLSRPVPLSDYLPVALWYPDDLATISDPSSAGHPLDRWFPDTANPADGHLGTETGQGGLVMMRNGWTYDSVAVLFKVSDEWQPHSHNDSSSFMLSAYGMDLVTDQPSGSLAQRGDHSVVLIGDHNDGAEPRSSYRGQFVELFSSRWAAYARADSRYPAGEHEPGDPADLSDDTWTPVERAERAIAFVREPRPYLIIADDVSDDGVTPVEHSWLLQLGSELQCDQLAGTGQPDNPIYLYSYYTDQHAFLTVVEPAGFYQPSLEPPPQTPPCQLTLQTDPAVEQRFLAILQPRRSYVDPEQPLGLRLAVSGGAGVDLSWSDGFDRVLASHGATATMADETSSDARLLLVRHDLNATVTHFLAAGATRVQSRGVGLIDTSGLEVTAALSLDRLEIQSEETPEPMQIVAFGPSVNQVLLNHEPVGFLRAGSYVLLPTDCGSAERCNGFDDDCDGLVDEEDAVDAPSWAYDDDEDGWGDSSQTIEACRQPEGYAAKGGDCDDDERDVYPGAVEDCSDGEDNDCNGLEDDLDPACRSEGSPADSMACACDLARQPSRPAGAPQLEWLLLGLCLARRRRRPR